LLAVINPQDAVEDERQRMKKLILAVAVLVLAGSLVQTAQAGVRIGIGIGGSFGGPVYYAPGYYAAPAPAPAYYYPQATYVAPAPRVVVAAPLCPPAVYVAPPVIGFGFGFRPFYRGYWGPRFSHRW